MMRIHSLSVAMMDLGLRLPSAVSFMMMCLPGHAYSGSRQAPNRLVPVQCEKQNLNRLHGYLKYAVPKRENKSHQRKELYDISREAQMTSPSATDVCWTQLLIQPKNIHNGR